MRVLAAAGQHSYAALTMGTEVATPSGSVMGLLYLNTQAVPMDSCDNCVADAMERQVRLQHGSFHRVQFSSAGFASQVAPCAHLILVIKTIL